MIHVNVYQSQRYKVEERVEGVGWVDWVVRRAKERREASEARQPDWKG